MATWTRLVAGTAAHEVNNLAQGLYNLLSLASAPTATPEALARYADLARDGLAELRRLGAELRALADCQLEARAQRLDLVCEDVLTDVVVSAGRSVERGPFDANVLVNGASAALRLAATSVLRCALASSPPGAAVCLTVSAAGEGGAVVVDAPAAPPLRTAREAPVEALLTSPAREFAGAAGLVLAGAIAGQYGGELIVGPGTPSGLRFTLTLPGVATAEARSAVDIDISYSQARADVLRDFDRAYLEELMRATGGNLSAAARRSGIDRSNLRRMLRQLGIETPSTAGN